MHKSEDDSFGFGPLSQMEIVHDFNTARGELTGGGEFDGKVVFCLQLISHPVGEHEGMHDKTFVFTESDMALLVQSFFHSATH